MGFSPLIYADKAENIAIQGRGVLDGQGETWWNYFRALKQDHKKTGVWKTDSRGSRNSFGRTRTSSFPMIPRC